MKQSIIIVQEDKQKAEELKNIISQDSGMEVIGVCHEGEKAIEIIRKSVADVVVTDLFLPGYDGLCILQEAKKMNANVKVFITEISGGDEWAHKVIEQGATYFMKKPFSSQVLYQRIKDTENLSADSEIEHKKSSLEEKISKIFINVGIPPHIKGYSYLREGVKMAVHDPDIINNITKKLYPSIGEKYNTTASKVERAIRHAIEVAWNRGRIDTINGLFGVRAYVGAEKPTNSEFIALVADKMLLERV